MGLAVRIWTTVARRPARVATELVGGKAMVHDWTTDVRKCVPRANEAAMLFLTELDWQRCLLT